MPKVRSFKEGQRLSVGNPTGFQSTGSARQTGELLSGLGKGIASAGIAYDKQQKRADAAEGRTASALYKAEMVRQAQDVSYDLSQKGGDGRKDREEYDRRMIQIERQMLTSFDKKYSGRFGDKFQAVGQGVIVGARDGILANSLKKQKEELSTNVKMLTAEYNGTVFNNPDSIHTVSSDYTNSISGLMLDLGANPDKIKKAHRDGQKALVNSAVDGYIRDEKWDKARELITKTYAPLYDTENQRKELKRIRLEELGQISRDQKEEDRTEKNLDKDHKESQLIEAAWFRSAIAKAEDTGNAKELSKLRRQAIKAASRNDKAYSAFGGILEGTERSFNRVSAEGSYGLAQTVYQAKNVKDLDGLSARISQMHSTQQLSDKDAERWEKIIDAKKARWSNNPRVRKEEGAYRKRLEAFTKDSDFISSITNLNHKKDMATRKALVESDYEIALLEGKTPAEAFIQVVDAHYKGSEVIEPIPGSGIKIRDREDLERAGIWAQNNLLTPEERAQADSILFMAENRLLMLELLEGSNEIDDLIKEKQKSSAAAQQSEEARQWFDQLINMDELILDRGNEQLLIFRR